MCTVHHQFNHLMPRLSIPIPCPGSGWHCPLSWSCWEGFPSCLCQLFHLQAASLCSLLLTDSWLSGLLHAGICCCHSRASSSCFILPYHFPALSWRTEITEEKCKSLLFTEEVTWAAFTLSLPLPNPTFLPSSSPPVWLFQPQHLLKAHQVNAAPQYRPRRGK